MKRRVLCLMVLALGATVPAHAEPSAEAFVGHFQGIHLNVPRALGGSNTQAASSAADLEVSLQFARFTPLVDPNEEGWAEQGGCVELFRDNTIDTGCGELSVEPDGVMNVTRVTGTIESTELSYSPENVSFEVVGPSTISIDLTFTGTGAPGRSPFSMEGVGVCGLPPDTRGVFVLTMQELVRTSEATGTLTSAALGDIDLAGFEPLMIEALAARLGVCV